MRHKGTLIVSGLAAGATCWLALLGASERRAAERAQPPERSSSALPVPILRSALAATKPPERVHAPARERNVVADGRPVPQPSGALDSVGPGVGSSRTQRLELRWREEATDATWTAAVEEYVLDALDTLKIPADSLGEVSCKKRLCKLTFLFDDVSEAQQLHGLRNPDFELVYSFSGDEYEVFIERE